MIALVAGTGALPGILADVLVARGDPPVICEMLGFVPDVRADLPRLRFRIETLATLLDTLKLAGVTRICMAGAVSRPALDPTAIDAATQPLIAPLLAAMAKGDDGTLRGIIAIIEARGFSVVGADQIAPDLLPPAGTLTRAAPTLIDQADADVGIDRIAAMGQADTGQACIVRDGAVLVQEDRSGTDAMLRSLCAPVTTPPMADNPLEWLLDQGADLVAGAADWLSGDAPVTRTGGILVKAPKPGQDRRADLPVIGPQTAMLAAEAGLTGIVIAAGGVMVIDQPQVVSLLDGQGMFLWVRP